MRAPSWRTRRQAERPTASASVSWPVAWRERRLLSLRLAAAGEDLVEKLVDPPSESRTDPGPRFVEERAGSQEDVGRHLGLPAAALQRVQRHPRPHAEPGAAGVPGLALS